MAKTNVSRLKHNPEGKMVKEKANSYKHLVLDLDHTLIHCEHTCIKKVVRHQIILRPHLLEFLNTLRKYYKLSIFTGAEKKHRDRVLKKIETGNFSFYKKLYKKDLENGKKKLDKILMDKTRIIIVDDNEEYVENKKNAIIIKPFYGDKNDNVLKNLEEILIYIYDKFVDVREGIATYKNYIKEMIN